MKVYMYSFLFSPLYLIRQGGCCNQMIVFAFWLNSSCLPITETPRSTTTCYWSKRKRDLNQCYYLLQASAFTICFHSFSLSKNDIHNLSILASSSLIMSCGSNIVCWSLN